MRVLVKSVSLWVAIVLLRASVSSAQSGWFQQQPAWPTTENLEGVATPDSSTIVAVGDRGIILRSSDCGASWASQFSGTASNLLAVSFVDANTGTAVGNSGTILYTSTGARLGRAN